MLNSMGRIIGIDYGAKRVGVAVSDDQRRFAFARDVCANDGVLLETLATLAEQESADYFVLGEADNPAGGENTIVRRLVIFSEALKVRTGLPVHLVSEAYSSAEARRALEEKIANRKDKQVAIDAAAAAIILQNHLDRSRHGS
jgi:putative holliday junction resolvase